LYQLNLRLEARLLLKMKKRNLLEKTNPLMKRKRAAVRARKKRRRPLKRVSLPKLTPKREAVMAIPRRSQHLQRQQQLQKMLRRVQVLKPLRRVDLLRKVGSLLKKRR
jgi:hypothetical protein